MPSGRECGDLASATLSCALRTLYPHLLLERRSRSWANALLPRWGESLAVRELRRQIDSAIDQLTDELVLIQVKAVDGYDSTNFGTVLNALTASIASLGPDELLARKPMLPSDVNRLVLDRAEPSWRDAGTSDLARACGRAASNVCAYLAVGWYRTFPDELRDEKWQSFALGSTLSIATRETVAEVRSAGIGTATGLDRIVGIQRRDLSSALNRIELFGLMVEDRFRRVPLDVSYLPLRLAPARRRPGSVQGTMDDLLARVASLRTASAPALRLLVVGRAGSGKTTVSQWLAHRGAQQKLPTLCPPDAEFLPLFVRLREAITSTRPPGDRALLYSTQLQESVDASWLRDCAPSTQPLLIFDGWDELGTAAKRVAREWIQSLIDRFPGAHVVVTSRPEGLDDNFFEQLSFHHVDVSPLSPAESREITRRWFRGLISSLSVTDDVDRGRLIAARDQLLRDLGVPAVGDMADSPLMTAMLCCLYATGTTIAPATRGRLYQQVTSALLNDRTLARRESPTAWEDTRRYDKPAKEVLLKRIAYTMLVGETFTLPVRAPGTAAGAGPDIRTIVHNQLPSLGRPLDECDEICGAMLDRSIVLHRVGRNEGEFAHRSIQDYLAAQAFTDLEDVDGLFEIASSREQWHLLPFSVNFAGEQFAGAICLRILERLQSAGHDSVRPLQFTLIDCLASATEVSDTVRASASGVIEDLFPPRTPEEAKSLAAIGDAAVPYLRPERIPAALHGLAIDTLAHIASGSAMTVLASYAERGEGPVAAKLVEVWNRFDPVEYARTVLRDAHPDTVLVVTDEARLAAVSHINVAKRLVVQEVVLDDDGLQNARRAARVESLDVRYCRNVGALGWTTDLRNLRRLSLYRCTDLGSIAELGPNTLIGLHLEHVDAESVDWGSLLPRLRGLRYVRLADVLDPDTASRRPGPSAYTIPASATAGLRDLRLFSVGPGVRCESLEFLVRNERLVRLELGWSLSDNEIDDVTQLTGVRHLSVAVERASRADELVRLRSLRTLELRGGAAKTASLLHRLDGLEKLTLRSWTVGLAQLDLPTGLRELDITTNGTPRTPLANLGELPRLSRFSWSGSGLEDLSVLRSMPNLQWLEVRDDGSLESLSDLRVVPDGCDVTINGVSADVDAAETIESLQRRGCRVVYEPDLDVPRGAFWVDLGGS